MPPNLPNSSEATQPLDCRTCLLSRDDDEFMSEFARKVASSTPPERTFLGLKWDAWVKFLLPLLVAASLGAFAWYQSVEEKPTVEEVGDLVKRDLTIHSLTPHNATAIRLEKLETITQELKESSIRAEQVHRTQGEVLREIRDDVKQLRRNHR